MKTMTLKLAKEIAGVVQERNTKIEGSTFNLPTWACNTGMKLAQVAGSVCEKCYATAIEKGVHGASVIKSTERNLAKWKDALDPSEWELAIASQIMAISNRKRKAGRAGAGYHRWFSSGDCQDFDMFVSIMRVAQMTPAIQHWFPTKEKGFVMRYLRLYGEFPENMNVRLSDPMIDGAQLIATDAGFTRSAVADKAELRGHKCPATFNKKQKSCDGCTACWDKGVEYIVYKYH